MSLVNNIKAIVLSVLIVTGSAMSSEADDSGFYLPTYVTSYAATFARDAMTWAPNILRRGLDGALAAFRW